MKLPLRTVERYAGRHSDIQIADATGRVVLTVHDCPEAEKIAAMVVGKMNAWRFFRDVIEHTRDDWLMERNTWRPS
jgi:hypothetical protein